MSLKVGHGFQCYLLVLVSVAWYLVRILDADLEYHNHLSILVIHSKNKIITIIDG